MVDGIKNGAAPKAVTTYMEEESRRAFESGKYDVHAQLAVRLRAGQRKGTQGRGQVQGRAVPDVRGRRQGRHPRRPQHGHLGLLEEPGRRAEVRSTSSTRPEIQKPDAAKYSHRAGARRRRTTTRRSRRRCRSRDELKQAIEQAKARPVSPVYPQISQAIYKNVNAALSGADVAAGRAEEGGRRDQQGAGHLLGARPWKPPPQQRRPGPAAAALPRASRSAASRASWSSPSMLLIALVAAYPILYAIWLSLHEYSVRVAGPLPLGRVARAAQLHDALQRRRVLERDADHVHLHGRHRCPGDSSSASRMAMAMHAAFKGQGLLRTVVLVPWAVLTVVTAIMWRTIFEPHAGLRERSSLVGTRRHGLARRRSRRR